VALSLQEQAAARCPPTWAEVMLTARVAPATVGPR